MKLRDDIFKVSDELVKILIYTTMICIPLNLELF